ncbi:MAG: protein kinase [Deltaproteobacteria bacterium]|nr:protein kinase [Deltaproteobacteria bacterium]
MPVAPSVADQLSLLYAEKQRRAVADMPEDAGSNAEILRVRTQLEYGSQLQPDDFLNQRYRLIKLVGTGQFANVWKAYDIVKNVTVAIKVLHRHYHDDKSTVRRFCKGAETMRELQHSAIVPVLELVAKAERDLFFVMKWMEGGDLARAVAARRRR